MKTSNDDKLLHHTLQEMYSDYPLPSRSDWEQEVMQKINGTPAPQKVEKRRKRTYFGWWAAASAVAAVGLLLLTVTFWPQPNTASLQQQKLAQTDTNKQVTVAPIEKESIPTPSVTPIQRSEPKEKPQKAVQTASVSKRVAKTKPTQAQSANSESTQEMSAESLPPYERPRVLREPRPIRRRSLLVTEEALRNMNDFSLAAHDKLMGIEVGQPKPENPFVPATKPTIVRVSQSMAATPITALGQDLQGKELAFRGTTK